MAHEKSGEQFLHERDTSLQKSCEVDGVVTYLKTGGEKIPNSPEAKIGAYLGFLASKEYVNDGILTGNQESIRRQIDARVVAAGDISESYFELQQRIAYEQGYGNIDITPEMRRQLIETVQSEQRAGLEKWVEYLGGDDGSYPDWFKYYTWESVTKLGAFDKEHKEFKKRSRGTTAPYPELNREALAYVFDKIARIRLSGEATDDEILGKLLASANFGKLYAHAVLDVTPDSPELRKRIEGSWRKYDQTTDPRTARRLSGSLEGHGTGWCTAGESTANVQLRAGDFYVYYTKDTDSKETIPRLAIRMENGVVSNDVRGVLPGQEVEPELVDTLQEKLQELPGGEEYFKKASDMKRLTELQAKLERNSDDTLSASELTFLYEFDSNIEGFGYDRDPRIDEVKHLRGERDMPEIARLMPEILRTQTKSAYEGYTEVARGVGGELLTAEMFEQLLDKQFAEWRQRGVIEYVVRDFIENGNKPNLVATPNVLVDWRSLKSVAVAFGTQQPYSTYTYDELWSSYTPEQLSSDAKDARPLHFSIIPSGYTKALGYETVERQRAILSSLQTRQPTLGIHVPRPLEALANWFTSRARGVALDFDTTYIRHFGLPERRLDGWSLVPHSYVDDAGWPYLGRSNVGVVNDARVAVG